MGILRRCAAQARDLLNTVVSVFKPYEPMQNGAAWLDSQYASGEWNYLRSLTETPRFGIVGAYSRRLGQGKAVLEIGCGDALLFEHLNPDHFAHFTGVDISAVAIEKTRPYWSDKVEFLAAEAESFTPARRYGVIIFNEVLEYFDDPLAVVRRYEPFLEPDGCFIVSMFSGWDTVRARTIWRGLLGRYDEIARAKVATHRRYRWNIRVLGTPRAA